MTDESADAAGGGDPDGGAGTDDSGRTKSGTFLVTHADEDSAVLQDVTDSEVHTLGANPDLAVHDVVEATLAAEPPMEVTWRVETVEVQRQIPTEESPEPPTRQSQEVAAEQSVGEVTTTERAGEGEVHVLSVPEEDTEQAVADVLDDEATLVRAARLGVNRVEVRSTDGVVSVRYLP